MPEPVTYEQPDGTRQTVYRNLTIIVCEHGDAHVMVPDYGYCIALDEDPDRNLCDRCCEEWEARP